MANVVNLKGPSLLQGKMWFYDEKNIRLHYGVKSYIKPKSDGAMLLKVVSGLCQPAGRCEIVPVRQDNCLQDLY
jgi:hypothetical protein